MSPDEFELLVRDFLTSHGGVERLPNLKVQHRSVLAGPVSSGEYEIDVTAEFDAFGGAKLVVVAECKRHSEPVKRDVVLALKAKRDALAAHKAMLFSTSGFQSGAVEYARAQGIALVTVEEPHRPAPRERPRAGSPWAMGSSSRRASSTSRTTWSRWSTSTQRETRTVVCAAPRSSCT